MAGNGVAPSIPKADFSQGGAGSGADLPFSADDSATPGTGDIIVHFKVATSDPTMVMKVTRIVQAQLDGQRVGARGICAIVTDESVEMTTTTKQILAAQTTPLVAQALGVTGIGV